MCQCVGVAAWLKPCSSIRQIDRIDLCNLFFSQTAASGLGDLAIDVATFLLTAILFLLFVYSL